MEKYLKKMSKEHEKLFPLVTLDSQIKKLEEEFSETEKAEYFIDTLDEIVDCFICCFGIYRFCPKVAIFIASSIINTVSEFGIKTLLLRKVKEKWRINLERKWTFKNETYHHEVENE